MFPFGVVPVNLKADALTDGLNAFGCAIFIIGPLPIPPPFPVENLKKAGKVIGGGGATIVKE